jgi:hypothetical protein
VNVRQVLVATQLSLAQVSGKSFTAIQRARQVKPNRAEQLGLHQNLIDLIPAGGTGFSLSIDFLIDRHNRLAELVDLINEDAFLSAVSLAPGVLAIAGTVSKIAHKILQHLLPAEERTPILSFSGDFNLANGGLTDGYIALLGTTDPQHPLPPAGTRYKVQGDTLYADGSQVNDLSYILLDVRRITARTRGMSAGTAWDERLRDAENMALTWMTGSADERDRAFNHCLQLIRDGQLLLRLDPDYQSWEADSMIKSCYQTCSKTLAAQPLGEMTKSLTGVWQVPDPQGSRGLLGIDPAEDLDQTLAAYGRAVAASQPILELWQQGGNL